MTLHRNYLLNKDYHHRSHDHLHNLVLLQRLELVLEVVEVVEVVAELQVALELYQQAPPRVLKVLDLQHHGTQVKDEGLQHHQ
jgi:hypothetical protein